MTQPIGCSVDADPLVTPVTLADAPGDNRLVVIVLRGAMDGLSAVQPVGDPEFAGLRGASRFDRTNKALDLDGFFALHPAMSGLMPLWAQGDVGFVHAVSTPYRDKRSHFDGQDLLEAGTVSLTDGRVRDGWLNRMLQGLPNLHGETAFAIGARALPLLAGDRPYAQWAPSADLVLSPDAVEATRTMMAHAPMFAQAFEDALVRSSCCEEVDAQDVSQMQSALRSQVIGGRAGDAIARYAAARLREHSRIAAFSISGWDTHASQQQVLPQLLKELSDTILTLHAELGNVWSRTTVVAVTEFGRTVRQNGTKGTDHGTGGAMVLAGGALRGGRVITDWPGLSEADLYDRRDLNATRDVRDHTAWIMRGMFGMEQSFLESTVFPGLQMQNDPHLIL